MKKQLFAIGAATLLSAIMVQAQGTFTLGNSGPIANGMVIDSPVMMPDGITPVSDANGRYEACVYWAAGAGVSTDSLSLLAGSTVAVGNFAGAEGYIATAPQLAIAGQANGSVVTLQLRVWDSATGATWDAATLRGVSIADAGYTLVDAGVSAPWAAFGTPFDPAGTPNSTPIVLSQVPASVPEPGTFALAGLGAAAMLIFRRRK